MIARRRWVMGLGVVAALVGAALAWAGSPSARGRAAPGPVVLVSGRDDHGLLVQARVPLQRAPDDPAVVAALPDRSFVRVIEERGEWMHVEALGDPAQHGWINDFFLRGQALRTDWSQQVTFADARMRDGRIEIAVRPIAQLDAAPAWVVEALLREVGTQRPLHPLLNP